MSITEFANSIRYSPIPKRLPVQLHQVKDSRDDHVHMPVHPASQRVDLRHRLVGRLFTHRLLDDRFSLFERQLREQVMQRYS